MKAIVLAILLLSPAIVLSTCTASASTYDPTAPCLTCVNRPATGAVAPGTAVNCATCVAGNKITTSYADCEKCPINTFSASGAMSCTTCPANSESTTTGTTSPTCTACGSGRFSAGTSDSCQACGANCDTCTMVGDAQCTACKQGFSKTQATGTAGTCFTSIANCAAHTSATVCMTCAIGYTRVPGTSPAADTCTGKIASCTVYTSDAACMTCATGTTLSTDKTKCDGTARAANIGIFSALSVALLALIALLN